MIGSLINFRSLNGLGRGRRWGSGSRGASCLAPGMELVPARYAFQRVPLQRPSHLFSGIAALAVYEKTIENAGTQVEPPAKSRLSRVETNAGETKAGKRFAIQAGAFPKLLGSWQPKLVSIRGGQPKSNFSLCKAGSPLTRTGRPRISSSSSRY